MTDQDRSNHELCEALVAAIAAYVIQSEKKL